MDKYENYELTDEQWRRIQPMLPPEYTGKKGRPKKDNRMMVNGMLWMNRSGAQWRQLPKRYGPWQSVYACFAKWRDEGIWEKIFGNVLKKLKGSDEERKKGERKGRKWNGNEDIDNKMSALRE